MISRNSKLPLLRRLPVKSIPQPGEHPPQNIADHERYDNQYGNAPNLKWLDGERIIQEMHPVNKIKERLRGTHRHKPAPDQMPEAQKGSQRKPGFIFIHIDRLCAKIDLSLIIHLGFSIKRAGLCGAENQSAKHEKPKQIHSC